MTDKELEQIYNEAYKAVYWTAMALLKNEADAEDIVQDTFVSLIESYDSIEDKSKVTAWLKKTAANKCLNRLTRTKTDNVEDEFFDSVEAVPEDFLPDSIIESEDTRKIIMDIIGNVLSEDVRRTLILFYFDEMSTKEIAAALGIPQGTVLWRLNFAKKKIKKEVEKYEEENDTKLYGMAIPFLSKLFIKEAEQVPFKAMPASLTTLSASAKAPSSGAAPKIAAEAAKKGTGIMVNKGLIIGIAATVVVVGTAAGITLGVLNNKGDTKIPEADKTAIEETERGKETKTDSKSNDPAAPDKDGHYYKYFILLDFGDIKSFRPDSKYTQEEIREGLEGEIIIPEGVTKFYGLEGCTKITKVVLPESMTELPLNCFQDCTSLEEVYLPDTITTLNAGSFWGCKSLRSVTMPKSLKNINGLSNFWDCGEMAIYFPAEVELEKWTTGGEPGKGLSTMPINSFKNLTIYVVKDSWMDKNYEDLYIDESGEYTVAQREGTKRSDIPPKAYWEG